MLRTPNRRPHALARTLPRRTSPAIVAGFLALGCASAATTEGGDGDAPPDRPMPELRAFSGFPDTPTDERVWVEARLEPGTSARLTESLVPYGVLPVWVKVGVLDGGLELARLSRDSIDAHLYLADGTPLGWIGTAPSDARPVRRAQGLGALPLSLLPEWTDAAEGYLLFSIPANVTIEGKRAIVRDATGTHALPLDGALLAFRVETAAGSREVRVGVRTDGPGDAP